MSTFAELVAALPPPPPRVERPPFARWLWDRNIEIRDAGQALGKSYEWVRSICFPFDDPRRVIPKTRDALLIEHWTHGEISPLSFMAPDRSDEGRAA